MNKYIKNGVVYRTPIKINRQIEVKKQPKTQVKYLSYEVQKAVFWGVQDN